MRKWRLDLQWLVVFLVFWVILMGDYSVSTLMMGLIVGASSLFVTERYLLESSYYDHYPLDLLHLAYYGIGLIYEIYSAGLSTIAIIVKGDINVRVVEIESILEDDYHRSILANSITLTPGTITLDLSGQRLTVLWLKADTRNMQIAGERIKGRLERRLLKRPFYHTARKVEGVKK